MGGFHFKLRNKMYDVKIGLIKLWNHKDKKWSELGCVIK